jgi:hypothetical protein
MLCNDEDSDDLSAGVHRYEVIKSHCCMQLADTRNLVWSGTSGRSEINYLPPPFQPQ